MIMPLGASSVDCRTTTVTAVYGVRKTMAARNQALFTPSGSISIKSLFLALVA
ncbi:hypothetical protein JCGZ_24317 [Jatropha curcas]|uniref:Uncharacterized protein n=1 Tax=Jatropha curcas TaxID=180498 RepID=A0A067JZJ5_JATCU|nr:hypothetical protein JCGZ_24317 [Jatropha curcas]